MIQVISLSSVSAIPLWNDFISSRSSPAPFSFNPSLFSFYQNHFDWKPCYVLLFRKNELFGLFPLVNTGRAWVSLPHFSYGGFLLKKYSKEIDEEQLALNIVFSLQAEKGITGFFRIDIDDVKLNPGPRSKIYLRSLNPLSENKAYHKVSSVLLLPSGKEEMLERLTTNLRRKIRKAQKTNLSVRYGGIALLNDFYGVYAKNMYRLGSPAYGKFFFSSLLRAYDFGKVLFFILYDGKKPVAAALLMSYNGFWENTWFSTQKKAQKDYVSDYLHWQMIKYALKQKAALYSFGRSDENGSVFRYKNHWPVENIPLYEYALNQKINLKNHKWLSGLWRKIPYPITYYLGPVLVNHIY